MKQGRKDLPGGMYLCISETICQGQAGGKTMSIHDFQR